MEHIIKAAIERGASDIHIKAGDVFRARINGQLRPLTKQRLTPEQTKTIALQLIATESVRDAIDNIRDYDCSWGAPGIGRFRVNILRQRSSFMIVMRVIPFDVPTFDKLGLPKVLERVAETDSGIVVITGATGSGKSSTIAAIVHHINSTMNRHLITLESPIEFLHRDLNSSVTQREIGVDTESYRTGVQAALRQDPDVVVIEELREGEVAEAALTAAETGRLLITTLHALDTASAVWRLVSMFPQEEQEVARLRVADVLQAIVSQRILPRADGEGRCVAAEVLVATPQLRGIMRDRRRAGEISQALAEGRSEYGTQTLDQHLADLVANGIVSLAAAAAVANRPGELESIVRSTGGGS